MLILNFCSSENNLPSSKVSKVVQPVVEQFVQYTSTLSSQKSQTIRYPPSHYNKSATGLHCIYCAQQISANKPTKQECEIHKEGERDPTDNNNISAKTSTKMENERNANL